MKKILLTLSLLLCVSSVFAAAPARSHSTEVEDIRGLLQQMIDVNLRYKDKFHNIISQSTLEQQTPHVTVLLCSDSRVDTDILSDIRTGELFVVRNIGNQLQTATGSIEYGVGHLHTELLLIVGHSQCGAVKSAMHDYDDISSNVKAELDTIEVNPKATLNQNLVHNVNHQVKDAVATFFKLIEANKLVVIGMIYDMHNDFKFGNGQLILLNINNKTDHRLLAENEYIKGLKNLVILDKGY
jgi:carbonic anhydrase